MTCRDEIRRHTISPRFYFMHVNTLCRCQQTSLRDYILIMCSHKNLSIRRNIIAIVIIYINYEQETRLNRVGEERARQRQCSIAAQVCEQARPSQMNCGTLYRGCIYFNPLYICNRSLEASLFDRS